VTDDPDIETDALPRPISFARNILFGWDELGRLAEVAEERRRDLYPRTRDPEGNAWAEGVRDVLRWLATGESTVYLRQLLGEPT
jgi:hypothetical protein